MPEIHFQREPLSIKAGKTINMLMITLGLMIVILAILFLAMISSSGQKGYELKQLQLENDQLRTEREKLKTELTETVTFDKIEKSENVKKMIRPEGKIFIERRAR